MGYNMLGFLGLVCMVAYTATQVQFQSRVQLMRLLFAGAINREQSAELAESLE